MALFEKLRAFIKNNRKGSPKRIASRFLDEISHEELVDLLAEEIQGMQRVVVRDLEKTVFNSEVFERFTASEQVDVEVLKDFEPFKALMKEEFKMGDGDAAIWGSATIEEHEQRIEMLSKLKDGLDDTISFHRNAIKAIKKHNATCWNDVLEAV